jgi:hypothetical protein
MCAPREEQRKAQKKTPSQHNKNRQTEKEEKKRDAFNNSFFT